MSIPGIFKASHSRRCPVRAGIEAGAIVRNGQVEISHNAGSAAAFALIASARDVTPLATGMDDRCRSYA